MPNADKGPRLHQFTRPSNGEPVKVYAGVKVGRAPDEVTEDLTVYQGVRLYELLEAVYDQGVKDGEGRPNPGRPRLLP